MSVEEFKIRVQLVKLKDGIQDSVLDNFIIEIPERVSNVYSTKSEAPFLVAQGLFERLKEVLERFNK